MMWATMKVAHLLQIDMIVSVPWVVDISLLLVAVRDGSVQTGNSLAIMMCAALPETAAPMASGNPQSVVHSATPSDRSAPSERRNCALQFEH